MYFDAKNLPEKVMSWKWKHCINVVLFLSYIFLTHSSVDYVTYLMIASVQHFWYCSKNPTLSLPYYAGNVVTNAKFLAVCGKKM